MTSTACKLDAARVPSPRQCLHTGIAARRPVERRRALSVGVSAITAIVAISASAQGATVLIRPNQDTSIYNESENSNALGGLFAGETPSQLTRRALLKFDLVASGIPPGSIINSVSLSLTQIKIAPAVEATFELRPLGAAWGEGSSSGTGTGGVATAGDATWHFRLFNTNPWTSPGGDAGAVSGTAIIGTAVGVTYDFQFQPGMAADVQRWLNAPASNFGWLLRASNESPTLITAREFGSRESSPAQQPTLTINYTVVPEPGTAGLLSCGALLALASKRRKSGSR